MFKKTVEDVQRQREAGFIDHIFIICHWVQIKCPECYQYRQYRWGGGGVLSVMVVGRKDLLKRSLKQCGCLTLHCLLVCGRDGVPGRPWWRTVCLVSSTPSLPQRSPDCSQWLLSWSVCSTCWCNWLKCCFPRSCGSGLVCNEDASWTVRTKCVFKFCCSWASTFPLSWNSCFSWQSSVATVSSPQQAVGWFPGDSVWSLCMSSL